MPRLITILGVFLLSSSVPAFDDAEESALHWTFDGADKLPGKVVGSAEISSGGLQSPRYPDFEPDNQVLMLESPSWVEIKDAPNDRHFDFDNGDEITLEAWIRINSIGENIYIISKGRTGTSGYKAINQNWAFRLRKNKGRACVNFLFRSRKTEDHPGDWHRWTSKTGISSGSRWHHVAVRYKFGDPKSIAGFIDGKSVKGTWDMGGETTHPPVVDDDDIWIGSTMGGLRNNSLTGALDNLAIHRRLVPDEELLSRYKWTPAPVKPPSIPEGRVAVQLFGPVNSIKQFPAETEEPLAEWQQDEMGFVRLPHKYDSWGVREDWGNAVLVRAWMKLQLPKGEHRLLARSRGMSRLKVDGENLLTTPWQKNYSGAHHVVLDLPDIPAEGMRPAAMSDSEQQVVFNSDGKPHLLLYEIIVGGPSYRLEFGETSVSVASPKGMFHILSDVSKYPLTDDGWLTFVDHQNAVLTAHDRKNRQAANSQLSEFWANRHAEAKKRLVNTKNIRSIDSVIQARIRAHNENSGKKTAAMGNTSAADVAFFKDHVQPIFDAHCTRCHGKKESGGFLIADRDRLLKGGESGHAAVVPGKPDESSLVSLVSAAIGEYRMPPKGEGLSAREVETIRRWISDGAVMPPVARKSIDVTPIVDDHTFLRRIFLDTVGVPPTLEEAEAFLTDTSPERRKHVIDRLLKDDRWADNWTGYWQDVLAENPNLLKPMLNNTGPFRFWIHEALTDNKPVDRFATELILMRGSAWGGGAAGFSLASQNDVPMAAKAHVIGSAFLGVNMKCARCHDAPYHQWKQGDLFQMAAMLGRKKLKLPTTSTVPVAFFEKQERQSLIEVSLKPGAEIAAHFPFAELAPMVDDAQLTRPSDSRERLAAQVTSSRRFAEVIANRVWKRLMGAGIVEPVDDWEGNPPSDPELLAALTDTLIDNNYNLKELARHIFESKTYQRIAVDVPHHHERQFTSPYRRRMSAEQVVDSAFHVAGQRMKTEQLTLDVEGTLPASRFLNFGFPERSWEFSTLANERDRPSLAIPKAQAIVDVLKAFGWRNSRPEPLTVRDEQPNLIQPGVLANGTVGVWLTRLSDETALTDLMLQQQTTDELIDKLFLKFLTRPPTSEERSQFTSLLKPGFESRIVPSEQLGTPYKQRRFRYVSWSNHLNTEANVIKMEMQELIRQGPPPTRYLQNDWRQRAEDGVWSLLNSPEMILVP